MSAKEDESGHAATAAAAEPQLSWGEQAAKLEEAQLIFKKPPTQIDPSSLARKSRQEIAKIQKKAARQTLRPTEEDVITSASKRPRSLGQDYDADACDPISRRGCVVMGGSRKRRRTLQKYRKSRKSRKGGKTKGGRKTQKKRGRSRRRRRTRRRTRK